MSVDLSGDVAVVTGAAGNLGRLWCRTLAAAGARVVGIDVAAVVEGCDTGDGVELWAAADVTDRRALGVALARALDAVGPLSILVNNAGIDQPPTAGGRSWLFEDIPDEVSSAVLDVNALGVLRVCQEFGPEMVRRGRGSVINIGSIYASVAPDPRLYEHLPVDPPFLKPPSYGMSKAGVVALTRYLAAMWGPRGVRVNTLSPGGVSAGQDETFRQGYVSKVPMGRMAEVDDLAGPLLFLASDLSRYVTGHELVVDGGLVCW